MLSLRTDTDGLHHLREVDEVHELYCLVGASVCVCVCVCGGGGGGGEGGVCVGVSMSKNERESLNRQLYSTVVVLPFILFATAPILSCTHTPMHTLSCTPMHTLPPPSHTLTPTRTPTHILVRQVEEVSHHGLHLLVARGMVLSV